MQGDAIDRKRQHAEILTAYILTVTDPLRYQLDLLSLTPAARSNQTKVGSRGSSCLNELKDLGRP